MIDVASLSKRYIMYSKPIDRLLDKVRPATRRHGQPLWALRDVSFQMPPGTSMGIVGINGAGKSTLLKILTGTTLPTSGQFSIRGRISSLLELGTGFHPEFTGRQNIHFNGKMAGLSQDELNERFDQIVAFSELGTFIDQPVRTYSSGMVLRLGFALASSVDPEVLIIDEALAVGDLHFQQKCLARIRRFHENGKTVLFVSHDPSMIKNFCNQAMLLDEGRMLNLGKPDQVLDHYTALMAEKYREGGSRSRTIRTRKSLNNDSLTPACAATESDAFVQDWTAPPMVPAGRRTGNFNAVITSVYFDAGPEKANASLIGTGQTASLCVRWVALAPVEDATVGIVFKDRLGQEIYGTNTQYENKPITAIAAGQVVETRFDLRMDLASGLYSITAAVHAGENHTETCYDWVEFAHSFQVLPDPQAQFIGICRLPTRLEIKTHRACGEELDFAQQTQAFLLGDS